MSIRYEPAPDMDAAVRRIARLLEMDHIDHRVRCVRSRGSRSRWTLARCHAMSAVFPVALGIPMHYVIEVISETFDVLDTEEKIKTLIHEMLHVPPSFGGGLKSHRYVTDRRTNRLYDAYLEAETRESGTYEEALDKFLA